MMTTGYCHSVETMGTVDGPGLRYVLFLSGCALSCSFCHNPDTWQRSGQTLTVPEVTADVERYRAYYDRSGGGITVSGGEPLLQPEFVAELFRSCRERGIHTLLDTAGYASAGALQAVLPYCDHMQWSVTAAVVPQLAAPPEAAEVIAGNLRMAAAAGAALTLRYVLIPQVTDNPDNWRRLAALVHSLPPGVAVELLPYHRMGSGKWDRLALPYALRDTRAANDSDLAAAGALLAAAGIEAA